MGHDTKLMLLIFTLSCVANICVSVILYDFWNIMLDILYLESHTQITNWHVAQNITILLCRCCNFNIWSCDANSQVGKMGHGEWTDVIYTMQESNLDTCGVRKRDEGGRGRQGAKGRKHTYLMCIASFQNILATNLLV